MKLKINKNKILQEFERGDLLGLDEVETQLENSEEVEQDVFNLVTCLYKLNFVLIETETRSYASKYNIQVQELYSNMKCDLFDILQIEQ